MTDLDFLHRATEVGNKAAPPYNFGAIVVKDGAILAEEINHVHENNDPTAHAETSAIRAACAKLGTHNLQGCTLYGSHEPCLMCFSCAAWARMERVVYAVAANEQNFTYEFEGISLQDMAQHLTRRNMPIDHIRLDAANKRERNKNYG